MKIYSDSMIPFTYVVNVSCGVSAIGSAVLQLDNSSDFVLTSIFAVSTSDNPLQVSPNNFDVIFSDTGTSRQFMNDYVPQPLLAGNVFNGTPEDARVTFIKNTNLNINVRNKVAATNVITVAFKGYKVFNI